eukprot:scaffold55779_cov49-Phaeocystis_antarctica.AAC.2
MTPSDSAPNVPVNCDSKTLRQGYSPPPHPSAQQARGGIARVLLLRTAPHIAHNPTGASRGLSPLRGSGSPRSCHCLAPQSAHSSADGRSFPLGEADTIGGAVVWRVEKGRGSGRARERRDGRR